MFSKFFIERPIFASVISIVIVIAGLVSFGALPVAQYPEITPPTVEGLIQTSMGKTLLRTKMRIWPGRGGVLETTLKAEIVQAMRMLDDQYADWMVSVNYEAEKKAELPLRRK